MNYRPLMLPLFAFLVSCMPEENLPIRDMGGMPDYFIECYCKPGAVFTLSATNVLPLSKDLQVDFSQEMDVSISAGKQIELFHVLYTLPGSDFIYNYGSPERLQAANLDSLHLSITATGDKYIHASTAIPPAITIYSYEFIDNEAIIRFYTSHQATDNYYIYTAEAVCNDSVVNREVCFLDYSESSQEGLVEKSMVLPQTPQARKIIFSLKRITRENYDYQISLSAANTANQSSITTPVPLKGNLNGALGIFTCYTEDQQVVEL